MTSNASHGRIAFQPYSRPGTLGEYLPDPTRPVERWYNRPNSGNATTARETILDLCGQPPTAVVDPFCGAGCTAVAARELGTPFYGIEWDPILACVSHSKAMARRHHAHLLRSIPELNSAQGLLKFCAGLELDHEHPTDEMHTACLAVLLCLAGEAGVPTRLEDIEADLEKVGPTEPQPSAKGLVRSGDCTNPRTWTGIPEAMRGAVVFTSPPFYRTGLPLGVSDELRAAASLLFPRRMPQPPASTEASYADNVIGMLRVLTRHLRSGWILMEHEPGDSTPEGLEAVAERIGRETDYRADRVLTTKTFSKAGPLSLIMCGRE